MTCSKALLDAHMNYSCGYWKSAKSLEEAQIAKMDLIATKLKLRPGMKVLEIGCGWGGLSKYLAQKYGVTIVAVTISKEQLELARKRCQGLPVEIELMDYRDLPGRFPAGEFDRIAAIAMFEHVGFKNYNEYFEVCRHCLKDDGLFLLHTIGLNNPRLGGGVDSFTVKHIFPGASIPQLSHILENTKNKFVMEDWHNFGFDYAPTLDAWYDKFQRFRKSGKSNKYDQKFFRMFEYYLIVNAEAFRARKYHLWQVVFSKTGFEGGYIAVR